MDENEVTIATMKSEHEEELASLKATHSTDIECLTSFQAEVDVSGISVNFVFRKMSVQNTDIHRLKEI